MKQLLAAATASAFAAIAFTAIAFTATPGAAADAPPPWAYGFTTPVPASLLSPAGKTTFGVAPVATSSKPAGSAPPFRVASADPGT